MHETSYMFGDNESQVTSSSVPYARLNKRHNILSYHFVRSMIAKGFISLHHIASQYNVADTLSKHWSHQANYKNLIKPLLNNFDYCASVNIEDLNETTFDGYEVVREA